MSTSPVTHPAGPGRPPLRLTMTFRWTTASVPPWAPDGAAHHSLARDGVSLVTGLERGARGIPGKTRHQRGGRAAAAKARCVSVSDSANLFGDTRYGRCARPGRDNAAPRGRSGTVAVKACSLRIGARPQWPA